MSVEFGWASVCVTHTQTPALGFRATRNSYALAMTTATRTKTVAPFLLFIRITPDFQWRSRRGLVFGQWSLFQDVHKLGVEPAVRAQHPSTHDVQRASRGIRHLSARLLQD